MPEDYETAIFRLKWPEITDNYQVEFVECRNQTVQDLINGILLALILIGPIALTVPRPI